MAGPRVDPWARLEAWRYSSGIDKSSNIRRALPGFGIGFAMFAAISIVETIADKKKHPAPAREPHAIAH